jgi:hypothetical protein
MKIIFGSLFAVFVGVPLFALPATLSLGWEKRPGLEHQTISLAVERLRETGKVGWPLVEAARKLVEERMEYSRRNSFDSAPRAFERGYGYCQQQAYMLVDILNRLGFEAKVVGAYKNKFPNGSVEGHAWVHVTYAGESRYVDSIFYDQQNGEITFIPLSKVFDYTIPFRVFAAWGSSAVNAYRFYITGKDI